MVALLTASTPGYAERPIGVIDDYRHHAKIVVPREPIQLAGAWLKWYDIGFTDREITDEVTADVHALFEHEAALGSLTFDDELGFVIVHDCARVVFASVQTWRGSNELWQTVYVHDKQSAGPFTRVTAEIHKPTFCVWEMAAVWHETQAWSRYLMSERTSTDRDEYFDDLLVGAIQ